MSKHKVLITTIPFGASNRKPLDLLEENDIEYIINPIGKKLTEEELYEMVDEFTVIIAGTEPITKRIMNKSNDLRHISRVGIGLDSVDLITAEKRGIVVSYTPDPPAPAVAEITIGLMLGVLRSIHRSNIELHSGYWNRYFGKRLHECTIGIIGAGRIGEKVLKHLQSFTRKTILVNDLIEKKELSERYNIKWASKEEIYKTCDIISLHLPLTSETKNMIKEKELSIMKDDVCLVNTSRGGIVNEHDLFSSLLSNSMRNAAIDVFEEEPYGGKLSELNNCLLTSHMGSMSFDCRSLMEIEATREAVRFINGQKLESVVPEEEYEVQREGL